MNNTPDKNTNTYTDYNLNGTPNRSQGQFRAERTSAQQNTQQTAQPKRTQQQYAQNPQNPQAQQQRQRQAGSQQAVAQTAQQRRPLNDEERRRLEAARMAAMQNGGRMTEEEIRRRRQEQQYLNAAQPQANPQRRVEIHNPTGGQRSQNPQPPTRVKKKKKIRINAGAVIFVLLIAGVIGVSVNQMKKNEEAAANEKPENEISMELPDDAYLDRETTDSTDAADPDAVTDETAEPNLTLYETITVSNDMLDEGDLILVNYQYPYADADNRVLKNAYLERTGKLKVASTDIGMTEEAFAALEAMVVDLTADTGCDDLLIVSGHRTVAQQQSIYDSYLASNGQDYVDQYVADPGYSEHHTGLACDLSFYTDEGYSVPISDHEFGYWLGENCMRQGFIRRYPDDKVDITKISYEAWHFRYVGVPHAYACTALNQCLEEYIETLKNYTADTKMLHIRADGTIEDVEVSALPVEGGWLTYYVPMTEGEETKIKLLREEMYDDYEISGNNVDGYIVTVTLD